MGFSLPAQSSMIRPFHTPAKESKDMKTIFYRVTCAALLLLVGLVNSQADEAPPVVANAETVAAIRAAAASWAAAWSSKDVEAYLGYYATDFDPPENMSREAWEQQRRQRLQRPAHISVELDWIGAAVHEDGSADLSFTQTYKSPTYSDQVVKTLSMVLENGQWKIRGERLGELEVPKAVTAAAEPAKAEAAQMEQEPIAAQQAAMKEAAEREAAAQEAAMREAAEREVAAKEAAMREAAEREAAAQEAAMREAAEREAAAQAAALSAEAEREAAMRAVAEEAARKAAAAYEAEQQAKATVTSVLKEMDQQQTQPTSAVKEAVVPREARLESGSTTWKIAGILMFLLLAPAVVYGTLVRPQQLMEPA